MIRRILAALLRPHNPLVNFLLPVGLSLLACSALAGWSAERDARQKNDADHASAQRQFARTKDLLNANIESISRAYLRITDSLAVKSDGVTTTRVQYRTVHDTLLQEFERAHSEVVALLPHLPTFIQSADSAVNACTEYQRVATEDRQVADSLIAALRSKGALLEHAGVWKPPRWTAEAEVLYDPLSIAPSSSGALTFRIAGGVSAVGRLEQRFAPGEKPRVYLGLRLTR